MTDLSAVPHRRFNPLSGDWILVSPHRTQRPWQGLKESVTKTPQPTHHQGCYLCPGNERAGGARNPQYTSPFVFVNDYSALLPDIEEAAGDDKLLRFENVRGECRVVCFSPRHDLTLPDLAVDEIVAVVNTWAEQTEELGRRYRWVQVFENKGAIMGCSNPHPHGQIWASSFVPNEPAKEDVRQREYFQQEGRTLLSAYLERELSLGERIVTANEDWVALVPYWAVWPFETLLLPRRPVKRFPELTQPIRRSLAEILKALLGGYDNLFETSFPYSMGWHGAPFDDTEGRHWHLHAHFYPPLLRSAAVRKFMVGFELLAEAQRDLTPEVAAARLREIVGRPAV
jgi:UDPglucose--hexose-1-phosphate uridylyltransferase